MLAICIFFWLGGVHQQDDFAGIIANFILVRLILKSVIFNCEFFFIIESDMYSYSETFVH